MVVHFHDARASLTATRFLVQVCTVLCQLVIVLYSLLNPLLAKTFPDIHLFKTFTNDVSISEKPLNKVQKL